jgi:malonyl-CoA/methylmalonyl-CoA synthetase
MPLMIIPQPGAHSGRTAIIDMEGEHEYDRLLAASARVAAHLLAGVGNGAADLNEARIAYLVSPSWRWPAVQWGIWRAGGVAVPLALSHTAREYTHVLNDAQVACVVADDALADRVDGIAMQHGVRTLLTGQLLSDAADPVLPAVTRDRRAMILYTSGTTSRPKGVVTTHANIAAQVASLHQAWEWRADDRILCVLPLHHVHGIVNVMTCALTCGAACVMHTRFDADHTWEEIAHGRLTLFMAVPTIYARLIAAWEAADAAQRAAHSAGCRAMRLMVSGSAALPVAILEKWRDLSGHTLLERYGMTEFGMALSNPLHGARRAGSVGVPLPGVDVRLVDDDGAEVSAETPGEIEVRGPGVFLEYWAQPEATRAAFRNGWFRTGDIAVLERGAYRILGRKNVDILKVGGYKISALEIEEVLREHPAISDCAVVGSQDPELGQRICAALVLREGAALDEDELRAWLRERLAPYKLPARLARVAALPRNAMGKVTKPAVAEWFQ